MDFQAKVTELETVDETGRREVFRMGLGARKCVLRSWKESWRDRSEIPRMGHRRRSDIVAQVFFFGDICIGAVCFSLVHVK
jgi:hypothetical protein